MLRFGEAAAGGDRYLFVTTSWDTARAARYGDTAGAGERTSRELNARFADWFYVISSADYQKLRPQQRPASLRRRRIDRVNSRGARKQSGAGVSIEMVLLTELGQL